MSGSQASKSRPEPAFSFFFYNFPGSSAAEFKWFEQGCLQRSVLPCGLFNYYLKQPALLGGSLLHE